MHRNLLGIVLAAASIPGWGQARLEIRLVAPLDEPRGYCVDMVGSKQRARIDRPLQAHTCYGYQGAIAVDQGIDPEALGAGRVRFARFDVCMRIDGTQSGASLSLAPCADVREQRFQLTSDGEMRPTAAPDRCLTVAGGPSAEGAGGTPVHRRRALSLETCDAAHAERQRWQVR